MALTVVVIERIKEQGRDGDVCARGCIGGRGRWEVCAVEAREVNVAPLLIMILGAECPAVVIPL